MFLKKMNVFELAFLNFYSAYKVFGVEILMFCFCCVNVLDKTFEYLDSFLL